MFSEKKMEELMKLIKESEQRIRDVVEDDFSFQLLNEGLIEICHQMSRTLKEISPFGRLARWKEKDVPPEIQFVRLILADLSASFNCMIEEVLSEKSENRRARVRGEQEVPESPGASGCGDNGGEEGV